ncbi:hypothetical protein FNV43_RR14029 [Rhamnella rubrinervis]|uniref:Uncharacterized protein n=1 Tax=Rhamnella rubrinervis TaxID=2594499 RepID=A0A8K0MG14_9ROSA|nr:hypothetical protein FNV43_RR14029 [Rhamnella rubrinervis]
MADPTFGSLYRPFLDVTELYIHGNIHAAYYKNAASLQSINGWIESLIDKWYEIENVGHKDMSWQEEREGRWWWEVDKAKKRDLIHRVNIKHEQNVPNELKYQVNGVADPKGSSSNQSLGVSTGIGIEKTALLSRPLLFIYTFWSHSFQHSLESRNWIKVILFISGNDEDDELSLSGSIGNSSTTLF